MINCEVTYNIAHSNWLDQKLVRSVISRNNQSDNLYQRICAEIVFLYKVLHISDKPQIMLRSTYIFYSH